jgi:Raf kinase inhibitor-like YbhB/YbcL family protein
MNSLMLRSALLMSIGLLSVACCMARPSRNYKSSFKLESPAFKHTGYIPARYTCDDEDISPALQWSGAPAKTVSYALIVDDPDALDDNNKRMKEPWVHWLVYNIPASLNGLPEGFATKGMPGVKFGSTNMGTTAFHGACPPKRSGVHHYHFKLYALDVTLNLPEGITKHKLLQAMEGHIVGQAELIGLYERR